MNDLTWVECPRDAWQGLPGVVPTDVKRRHLTNLLAAGFHHLDLGSFVSPQAVPQLADTEAVLAELEPTPQADLLCIIGNERGLDRALAAHGVSTVGYPLSVNDTFQRRNVGRSLADSWPVVERLQQRCASAGMGLVVYLSMGFGNPYGEPWNPEVSAAAVERLRHLGVNRIALADTIGNADAERVAEVLDTVALPEQLGLHLHSRPGAWQRQLEVALERGVRWFEGAFGGIGGCPFAGDELVGNLPTEKVLPFLNQHGFELLVNGVGVDDDALAQLSAEAERIAAAASSR